MAKRGKGKGEGAKSGPSKGARETTRERAARRRREREAEEQKPSAAAEWAKSIAIAGILFIVLRTFLLQTFVITSGSMKETLLVGDMLIVNRAALGARIPGTQKHLPGYSEVRLGDVVVFDPHHDPDLKLIKRLVGMPGDTLEMRQGDLYRNGVAQDEPYVLRTPVPDGTDRDMLWQRDHLVAGVDRTTYRPTRDTWGPLVVPDEHYFMLGDNRNESLDSRYWGPLASWRLEGRAVLTYYSYDKESFQAFKALREVRWGRIGQMIR